NLKRAVHGILENFSPDYFILETSGLANPFNLLEDMAELADVVRFDSTVTIVDALNLEAAMVDSPIAADQIKAADVIVMNKRDLVDAVRLEAVRRKVRQINPRAPVFCTTQGDLNPALIFDADDSAGFGSGVMRAAESSMRPKDVAGHATHAEAGLWAQSLRFTGALDREKFTRVVTSLPPSVFRAKGLVDFTDSDETMLFQYVCGRFELSVFPRRERSERFLTLIGRGSEPCLPDVLEALSALPVR
ncbi:MAG: CobW family GTP-binding protein, partial [Hyphomicrobiales bacterium]